MRRTVITLAIIFVAFVLVMIAVAGCKPTKDGGSKSTAPSKVENVKASIGDISVVTADGSKRLQPGKQVSNASKICTLKYPASYFKTPASGYKFTSGTLSKGDCLAVKRGETVAVTVVKKLDKVRA